jgi:hypothetical protein
MLNFHGWDVTSLFLLCEFVRDARVHGTTLLHFLMNESVIELSKRKRKKRVSLMLQVLLYEDCK